MPVELVIRRIAGILVGVTTGVLLLFLMTACGVASSRAAYESPTKDQVMFGSGATPIDPDTLQVDSSAYPKFHVLQQLLPPEIRYKLFTYDITVEMVPIDSSDTWYVTHIFAGRYLIQSDEYNERECRFLANRHQGGYVNPFGTCKRDYDYAIYVTPSGEITGGWQLLPGSRMGGTERYTRLSYAPTQDAGWPMGSVFRRAMAPAP